MREGCHINGRAEGGARPRDPESVSTEDVAPPKQAGNFPMWCSDERFVEVMEEIYHMHQWTW